MGSIITSLVSVALGGVIGFLSARRISDLNARATASAKFRVAFAPALAQLDLGRRHGSTHAPPDFDEYFGGILPSHAAAFEEFRVFVVSDKLTAYQEAWADYYHFANGGQILSAHYNEDDPWSVIEEKINKILSFAKT